jgi:hypothetical protein
MILKTITDQFHSAQKQLPSPILPQTKSTPTYSLEFHISAVTILPPAAYWISVSEEDKASYM